MKPSTNKSKIQILIIIISSILVSSCSSDEVKVMTWNIWHGGLHGVNEQKFEKDTVNTLNVTKVIKEQNPDIILMQETYCCGMERAKEAGYEHFFRGSSNLSIHSKYPIIDTIRLFRPFFSHGVIIDVNGKKIMCFNIWIRHIPPYFENIKIHTPDSLIKGEAPTRLNEITSILNEIKEIKESYNMPVIIGGDFNSGSHLDWVESTKKYHYNKVVEWPVSKLMYEHGYKDSYREKNPLSTEKPIGTFGYLYENLLIDRIDYIYYKGDDLKIKSSKIICNDPPNGYMNSDHRPVVTTFEL